MELRKLLMKMCAGVLTVALVFDGSALPTHAYASLHTDSIDVVQEEIIKVGKPKDEVTIEDFEASRELTTTWTEDSLATISEEACFRYTMKETGYYTISFSSDAFYGSNLPLGMGEDADELYLGNDGDDDGDNGDDGGDGDNGDNGDDDGGEDKIEPTGTWIFQLYENNDIINPIYKAEIGIGGSLETPEICIGPNELFISVTTESQQKEGIEGSTFRLRVNPKPESNWENEGNNDIKVAMPIEFGETYKGTMYKGSDEDFYKVTIPRHGYFKLDFKQDKYLGDDRRNDLWWAITFYDTAGETLANIKNVKENNTYVFSGIAGEDVYMRITADSASSCPTHEPYNLKVDYYEADEWEYENNSESNKANVLKFNQVVKGALNSESDEDWYSIDVPASTKDIELKFTCNKPTKDMHINPDEKPGTFNITAYIDGDFEEGIEFPVICKDEKFIFEGEAATIKNAHDKVHFCIKPDGLAEEILGIEYSLSVIDADKSSGFYTLSYNGIKGADYKIADFTLKFNPKTIKKIKLPTSKQISKKGYKFTGWTANVNGKNKKFTSITKKTANGTTFTAQWKENKYSIKYVILKPAKGVKTKGKEKGQNKILYTDKITLSKGDNISADGYKFIGWALNKEATNPDFKPGETVSGLEERNGKKVKLYAIWEPANK